MKADIKSEYEVSFYGSETKAIVFFSFWKEVPSGDYDVPSDPATVEIDKIEINNVDLTDILFEIAETWVQDVEVEILDLYSS